MNEGEDMVPADITLEQFRANEQAFRHWYAWFGHWATILVLLSFAGYAPAFWVWYRGDNVSAILIVTAFYLLFRLHRRLLFKLAERKFISDPTYREPLRCLERLRVAHKEHGALAKLGVLLGEADREKQ